MTEAPVEHRYVTADDGVRIAYRSAGRAERVAIVPASSWLANDLAPLADHARLVFYDVRGQGASDPVGDDRIGFARDVQDVECLRRELAVERIALLGWSYHGAVAARYAFAHPDRVERLLLVGPVAPRAAPHWRHYLESFGKRLDVKALRALEAMRRARIKDQDPLAWCRAHTELILKVYVADPVALRGMKSSPCVRPNLDPEAVNQQMLKVITAMGDYDWRSEMHGFPVATLILHGDRDPVPLAGSHEWVAALPNARLVVLPGCGHLPWLEQPDRFFPECAAFLRGDADAS